MLTWLLLSVLGIIWAALLLPSRSRSPKSSVEEFEQKMNLLAEANRVAPGRWVLIPCKGQRFMGPDRGRARVKRRRRQVFMVLVEATALTFIMGLFPPFRIMLGVTVVLVFLLLVYMAVLVRLRAEELERARVQGAAYQPEAHAARYGNGKGNGHELGPAGNGYGYGNGHRELDVRVDWLESGLRLVDDDVHVVVYRSDEIDTSSLTRSSG